VGIMAKNQPARLNSEDKLSLSPDSTPFRTSRPAHRKGKLSERNKFVRSVVREVVGFSPYERRVLELLRNGKDKKARKLTKKRLGTLLRSKRKIEELQT
ncbi:11927_t:CDS:2, partial [Acaulospora colombiana]